MLTFDTKYFSEAPERDLDRRIPAVGEAFYKLEIQWRGLPSAESVGAHHG